MSLMLLENVSPHSGQEMGMDALSSRYLDTTTFGAAGRDAYSVNVATSLWARQMRMIAESEALPLVRLHCTKLRIPQADSFNAPAPLDGVGQKNPCTRITGPSPSGASHFPQICPAQIRSVREGSLTPSLRFMWTSSPLFS